MPCSLFAPCPSPGRCTQTVGRAGRGVGPPVGDMQSACEPHARSVCGSGRTRWALSSVCHRAVHAGHCAHVARRLCISAQGSVRLCLPRCRRPAVVQDLEEHTKDPTTVRSWRRSKVVHDASGSRRPESLALEIRPRHRAASSVCCDLRCRLRLARALSSRRRLHPGYSQDVRPGRRAAGCHAPRVGHG